MAGQEFGDSGPGQSGVVRSAEQRVCVGAEAGVRVAVFEVAGDEPGGLVHHGHVPDFGSLSADRRRHRFGAADVGPFPDGASAPSASRTTPVSTATQHSEHPQHANHAPCASVSKPVGPWDADDSVTGFPSTCRYLTVRGVQQAGRDELPAGNCCHGMVSSAALVLIAAANSPGSNRLNVPLAERQCCVTPVPARPSSELLADLLPANMRSTWGHLDL